MSELEALIQLSLGVPGAKLEGKPYWPKLLDIATKQSLLGVTVKALDLLPEDQAADFETYAIWAMKSKRVSDKLPLHIERCRQLSAVFAEGGFRSCVLKGVGLTRYYPEGVNRHQGDIDIWVEGDRKQILKFIKDKGMRLGEVCYHHADVHCFKDIPVEVHFMPSWMNSVFYDRRLQKYFNENSDVQFSNIDPELGFAVPTTVFDAFYCLLHIFRHLFLEGVGLRQVVDYCLILKALAPEKKAEVMRMVEYMGLGSCASALMYVLQKVCGLEDEYLLCPPDPKKGEFFLNEIYLAGNFGKYDPRNFVKKDSSRWTRLRFRLGRLVKFIGFFPREILATPSFKFVQYVWRRYNNYL